MFTYKTLVRDTLVDSAGIKTLFGAAATGSCRVNMEDIRASAVYPQVLIGYSARASVTQMGADEGTVTLTIESKTSGTTHAHKEIGNFRSAILTVLDETSFASTAVCYYCKKVSEVESFNDDKNVYSLILDFDTQFKRNVSVP